MSLLTQYDADAAALRRGTRRFLILAVLLTLAVVALAGIQARAEGGQSAIRLRIEINPVLAVVVTLIVAVMQQSQSRRPMAVWRHAVQRMGRRRRNSGRSRLGRIVGFCRGESAHQTQDTESKIFF